MKKLLAAGIDLAGSFGLYLIYVPLTSWLFQILPLTRAEKFFAVPVIEETLRFVSICLGGLTQYAFTLIFAISEYINYLGYARTEMGMVPDGYSFYRFLCIFVHVGLLWYQIKMFRKYQRTKRKYYLFVGFFGAVALHELYNHSIGSIIYSIVVR